MDDDRPPWLEVAEAAPAAPLHPPAPGQLAYVLYTSGSSGRPKAVAVEHRNLAAYIAAVLERLEPADLARVAHASTFAADLGHTGLFPTLASGGAVHVLDEDCVASATALASYLMDRELDFVKIAPSHLRALLATAGDQRVLPRRCVVLGGEALDWDLAERVTAEVPRLFNHYGPTETTIGSIMHSVTPSGARHSDTVPLGTALAGEPHYVLDQRLAPVPAGVPGELFIGGAGVARGYVARPGLTASRFLPDPFAADPGARMYRTGDRVYRNLDGTLVFLGRTDLQFKLRGFRIEPGEIEAALEAHPAVSQAAVAKWSQGSDERLIAYLVPERGRRPDTGELRQFVRARMVPHQCPSTYVFLRALPISANGKLDRSALPEPDLQRPEVMSQFVAPRGDTEQELAAMWSQLLGVERVGADDHFFDLGGHSLLLVQLISLIRERFHCTLRVTDFFKHSTVRTLAERIAAERGGVSAKAASRDAGAADQRATERANARNRSRGSGAERRAAARSARRTGPRGGESR